MNNDDEYHLIEFDLPKSQRHLEAIRHIELIQEDYKQKIEPYIKIIEEEIALLQPKIILIKKGSV